jgi:hypothetical protein
MNDLDERIFAALRAQADTVREADLPELDLRRRHPVRWIAPLLAAAAVLIVVVTIAVAGGPSDAGRSVPPIGPEPTNTAGPTEPQTELYCVFDDEGCPAGGTAQFVQLWPFASYEQAKQWETVDGPAGHSPWHTDVKATALFFVQNYLGFHDIDTVTSLSIDDWPYARVGVGYVQGGAEHTAAVVQLVRYSPERGDTAAGWEVVGASSDGFWLDTPSDGNLVSSPMTVLGRITGVDDNITLAVRTLGGSYHRADPVPAGGRRSPWSATVTFTERGHMTVVASTGGHTKQHERFAVVGVVSAGS